MSKHSANRLPGLQEPGANWTSTQRVMKSGAVWLASATQEEIDGFLASLSEKPVIVEAPLAIPARRARKSGWLAVFGRRDGK